MSLNLQKCYSTASFVLLIFIVIKFSYQKLIIVYFLFLFKLYTYLTVNPCYSLPSASCNHYCFLFLWICMLCAFHLMGPDSTQPRMLASTVKRCIFCLSIHVVCHLPWLGKQACAIMPSYFLLSSVNRMWIKFHCMDLAQLIATHQFTHTVGLFPPFARSK